MTMKKAPQSSASAHQRRGSGAVRGAYSFISPPDPASLGGAAHRTRWNSVSSVNRGGWESSSASWGSPSLSPNISRDPYVGSLHDQARAGLGGLWRRGLRGGDPFSSALSRAPHG